MKKKLTTLCMLFFLFMACKESTKKGSSSLDSITSGNPIFEGWYADPEAVVFKNEYWVYHTYSYFTGIVPWEDGSLFMKITSEFRGLCGRSVYVFVRERHFEVIELMG
ncbi:hypothetical protein [Maribacter arenosus]|uniref:Glycosyl hydrolases family 43 n=1 Tax=Maribacter arenosus TaxID=1854708 RepID=A0ABR7VAN0_9FLAO|nr:hypothetical protein [Maribacter arenosus]MBD0850730.1 hypothetical protein [Maribacter arenosus]